MGPKTGVLGFLKPQRDVMVMPLPEGTPLRQTASFESLRLQIGLLGLSAVINRCIKMVYGYDFVRAFHG